MSYAPIAYTIPQYEDNPSWWMKAYIPGGTTPKVMATDVTGDTTVVKFQLNIEGFPVTAGSALIIPFIDGAYDLWLFPTETEADANNTASALKLADNIIGFVAGKVAGEELTVSDMTANTNNTYRVGDVVNTKEFSTGNGGGGTYDVVLTSSVTPNTFNIIIGVANILISFVLRETTPTIANRFDIQISPADSTANLLAAINDLPSGQSGGSVISLQHNLNYVISGSGIEIPPNVTLDNNGAKVSYTGTGTAFTLGNSDSTLSFYPKLLNLNLRLIDKASKGVLLRATTGARVEGYVEAEFQPFDNTRTNLGLHIDARNANSFFNEISLRCNHVHDGFLIQTTGSVHSTQHYFRNCQVFSDQATDDSGTAYSFGDGTGSSGEGNGTVITGGYIEKTNTAFKIGALAGSVTVDGTVVEIVKGGGTAWIFDFVDGCAPWIIKAVNGLGSSYMESNNGIRNFDSANHILLSDDQGSIRQAGFDGALNNTTFLGIGGTNPEFRHNANSELYIYSMGGATDTGRTLMQQGFGSASHGGHIDVSGAAHATRPGDCTLGPGANGGVFRVNKGLNGTAHFTVSPQTGRINMIIPTSSAGLAAGDIWSNSGILTIV